MLFEISAISQSGLIMSGIKTYSRLALLSLGAAMQKHQNKVTGNVYKHLKELNICAAIPTKRGTKGFGRLKVPVRTTCQDNLSGQPVRTITTGLNIKNLLQVKLTNTVGSKPHNCQGRTLLSVLNARSVCNKEAVINDCITENDLDMLALTETWLNSTNENRVSAGMTPEGYDIISLNRR